MNETILASGEARRDRLDARDDPRIATRKDWIAFLVVLSILWIVPLTFGGFYLYLGAVIAIYAIATLGLQVMVGLAGQLSLGHAAFVGIGAYTAVLLEKNLGWPFLAALPAAGVAAGLAGLLMAQMVRLSGVYFKVATFGFGIVVFQILANWSSLTGGHVGVRGIPPIQIFGIEFTTRSDLFILEMVVLTLVYGCLVRLCHGRIGRAFRAIGQNESAARSIGIPVNRYRMTVISLGSAIAGLGGAFMPHLMRFVSPESFTWHESLIFLIMITVGGLASLPGAVVGAAVLTIVPEYLRGFAEYKMFVFGLLLIASMILMPAGIVGGIDRLLTRLRATLRT